MSRLKAGEGESEVIRVDQAILDDTSESGHDELFEFGDIYHQLG